MLLAVLTISSFGYHGLSLFPFLPLPCGDFLSYILSSFWPTSRTKHSAAQPWHSHAAKLSQLTYIQRRDRKQHSLEVALLSCIYCISFIPSLISAAVIAMLLIGFAIVSKTQYMRVINLMSITTVLAIVLASYLIHIPFVLQLLVLFCGVIHILFFFVDASDKYRIHASDYVTFEDKYGFPAVVTGGLIVALSYLVVVGLDMTLMSHDSPLLPSIYVMSTWSKCSCIIMLFSVVITFLTALVKCLNCITSQHAYTRV
ncbi:hypothetical protein AC1031_019729 [Aphanomyces cochlioides]|nr:hypothetical protein AC1031_019729 [Aphanomyces cochlioides]